jgi:copper(I)-binding protein
MLAVAGITALAAPGHDIFASEFKVGAITIKTPWSRATPGGAKVAAGYPTIKNGAGPPTRSIIGTT